MEILRMRKPRGWPGSPVWLICALLICPSVLSAQGGYGTANIALNRPVAISAKYPTVRGNPDNITAGNFANAWYAYQGTPSYCSLVIDLGKAYSIGKVEVGPLQTFDFQLYGSADGTNYTQIGGKTWAMAVNFPVSIAVNGAFSARYIKYEAHTPWAMYVGVSAIRAYEWLASPPASPPASAYGTTNLAKGKTIQDVTGFSSDPKNPARNVVDGDPATTWYGTYGSYAKDTSSYDFYYMNGSVLIDLGQSYKIGKITVKPKQVQGYGIYATPDSTPPGNQPAVEVPYVFAGYPDLVATANSTNEEKTFYLDGRVSARHVWLATWMLTPGATPVYPGVNEIEVYEFVTAPPACAYTLSAASASLNASGGTGSFNVTAASGCSWTATSSATWITISSGSSGSGNGTVNYTVVANTSTVSRTGTITAGGQAFTVSQAGAAVTPPPSGPPVITPNSVVNTADYTAAVAPGGLIAVFGTNLAPRSSQAGVVPLPTSLEGSSVEVTDDQGTRAIPLFFVSPGQINAQLPFDLSGNPVNLRVRASGGASISIPLTLSPVAARLFTKTMDGKGDAIVLHADYSVVSAQSPAKPGEVVILYLTAMGAVDPPVAAGARPGDGGSGGPLNLLIDPVVVTVGGYNAKVQFAGLAPYFAGLYQVNFEVPPGVIVDGPNAILVMVAGSQSQDGVNVAVATPWKVIATSPVGPGGATVAAGGLQLTVPPGAFAANETVTLRKVQGNRGLDNEQATDTYQLDGLPDHVGAPLTLRLDITNQRPGASAFIELDPGVRDGLYAGPIFLDAHVDGNQIVATIPAGVAPPAPKTTGAGSAWGAPATASPSSTVKWPKMQVQVAGGLGGGSTRLNCTGNNRFVLLVRSYTAGTLNQLCPIQVALEDALVKLGPVKDKGLVDLDLTLRKNWPIEVVVYPFTKWLTADTETWGYASMVWWDRQNQQIELNSRLLTTSQEIEQMKVTAGHELFHLVQALYDPRPDTQLSRSQNVWDWMADAASTWFERAVSPGSNAVPTTVTKDGHAFLTRHGLEYPPGTVQQLQEHGYGASMFLEHLTSKYKPTLLRDLYNAQKAGTEWPVSALETILFGANQGNTSALTEEWIRFCRSYAAGTVYSSNPVYPAPQDVLDTAELSNPLGLYLATDRAKTYRWSAPDLSAKFFKIELRNLKLSKDTTLRVRLSSNMPYQAEGTLYSYGRTAPGGSVEWNLVGRMSGNGSYEYKNAEVLEQNKVTLLLMVTNGFAVKPYNGTTPITIMVELLTGQIYRTVNYSFSAQAVYNNNGTTVVSGQAGTVRADTFPADWASSQRKFNVTWSGNTFSLSSGPVPMSCKSGDPPDPKCTWEQTLTGTFDFQQNKVLTLKGMTVNKSDWSYPDAVWGTWVETLEDGWEAAFHDILCQRVDSDIASCEIKGPAVEQSFTSFKSHRVEINGAKGHEQTTIFDFVRISNWSAAGTDLLITFMKD